MSKYIIDWESPYARSCRHEDAERYGDGLYCVYFWEDEYNEVFYVGSGKGYRFNDTNEKSRRPEFMEWVRSCKCHPRIVAYGMSKEESMDFERRLITAFWERGFPLVNVAGIPEREKEVWRGRGKKISKTMLEKKSIST